MEKIEEFVDERHKGWCVYCRASISKVETNWDHVPTKSLLDRPLPAHIPQIEVCKECNSSFSFDEEYVAAFISCVMCGSADPDAQHNNKLKRTLARSPALVSKLNAAKKIVADSTGNERIIWQPEIERIHRIVIKNARGHAFFEFGEPMLDEPEHVWALPLAFLTEQQRKEFEAVTTLAWPEVGSRMMIRMASGADLENGWITVQDGVYRYAVLQEGTLLVRSVIRNYLATEVFWS
jgi:hypothetical protein